MFKKLFFLLFILFILTGCKNELTTTDDEVTQYTITFDSNGGSDVSAITQAYNSLVTAPTPPTKEGYTFIDWYKDNDLTEPFTFSKMPRENITLYAKWDPNKPTFASIPADQTIKIGTSLDLLSLGLTASDDKDGDLTSSITVDLKDTTILTVGKHIVTYSVTNSLGEKVTTSIHLIVNSVNAKYFTLNSQGDTIIDYDAKGASDVVIPEYIDGIMITAIGDKAFYRYELTSVTIPDTVSSIGINAFDFKELNEIYINETNPHFEIENNLLLSKDKETLIAIIGYHDSVNIPDGVVTIKAYAFARNDLTSVSIPNSVKTIEDYAFSRNDLTDIIISNGVTTIGSDAFAWNSLRSVIIPDSVTTIKSYAFSDNELTSVTIPKNVTTIGVKAFDFNQLDELMISEANQYFKIENNLLLTKDNKTIITLIGNHDSLTIPDGVTTINAHAFSSKNLTDITLPDSVTTIEDYAFYGNSLTSLTIPDSVTTIGAYAFNWNNLTSVTFPDSLTTIKKYAFYNNELTNVTIPKNVTTIGVNAFDYNQLAELIISATNQNFKIENNLLLTKDNKTLIALIGDHDSITIPDGITTIRAYAFWDSELTSVMLPESLTTIEENAFAYNRLSSVIIPNSVTTIGEEAFIENELTSVTLSGSLTTIGANAFYGNYLASISIPNSVTKIEEWALAYNDLTSVIIPDSVIIIEASAFESNYLTSVTLSKNLTKIGEYAFYDNGLTSVTLPNSVTTIGYYAFFENELSNITIEGDSTRFNDDWESIGFPIALKP